MTIDPVTVSPAARLYLRPVWFADSPIGLDGRTARIGNGLVWYQGIEASAREGTARPVRDTIAVERLDQWIAALPGPVSAQARAQVEIGRASCRERVSSVV